MAYTINLANGDAEALRVVLIEAARDAGFNIGDVAIAGKRTPRIELRSVRLAKAKPYCGNHAGPCAVGARRRTGRWLEGHDWMQFHRVVNRALDVCGVRATIYTLGVDTFRVPGMAQRRMLVRTVELGARKRFDYRVDSDPGGRPHNLWNPGTPDQWRDGDGLVSEAVS